MGKNKLCTTSILTFTLILLLACNTPRKTAKLFVKQTDSIGILLIPPTCLFKSNLKIKEIENFDLLDDEVKDSLWNSMTLFLQNINDSVFMTSFFAEVANQLKPFGFHVFLPSEQLEFASSSLKYKYVNEFAQLELDEFNQWHDVDYDFIEQERHNDFLLNGLTLNTWLKQYLPNLDTSKKVLFSEYSIRENIKGHFFFNDGDLVYVMKSKRHLTQQLADSLWQPAAKQLAQYLSDFYLNNFVSNRFKDNTYLPYYTYDAERHKIRIARNGRFTIM